MEKMRHIAFDCYGLFAAPRVEAFFDDHFGSRSKEMKDHFCVPGDSGQISYDEFLDQLSAYMGMPKQQIADEISSKEIVNTDMIELLKEVGKHHHAYLLSNCMEGALEHTFAGYEIFPYFEKQYRSYALKMVKPNADIFLAVLDDNHIEGKELIFFDDNPKNVEAARRVGIEAYVFKDVPSCRKILKEIGIL